MLAAAAGPAPVCVCCRTPPTGPGGVGSAHGVGDGKWGTLPGLTPAPPQPPGPPPPYSAVALGGARVVELAEEWGWRVVGGTGAAAVLLASASAGCDCGEGSLASEDGDSAATGDQNGFAPCKAKHSQHNATNFRQPSLDEDDDVRVCVWGGGVQQLGRPSRQFPTNISASTSQPTTTMTLARCSHDAASSAGVQRHEPL